MKDPQAPVDREALTNIWRDFLEANPDDLTSPEDLPDHALVTFDQFADMVAAFTAPTPAPDVSEERARAEVYRVLRDFHVSNMADQDGNPGFPLVDLVSNEPPADISTGEEQLHELAYEISTALLAFTAQPAILGEGELRPEVLAFAHLMERQLRANDHKAGWKNDLACDLIPRLREESIELEEATNRHAKRVQWGDDWVMEDTSVWVGNEAADVANFAMMIADVCGALPTPSPEPVASQGVDLRASLKLAIDHIEHMAAWIGRHPNGYRFEALGEDWDTIKAALSPSSPAGEEGL